MKKVAYPIAHEEDLGDGWSSHRSRSRRRASRTSQNRFSQHISTEMTNRTTARKNPVRNDYRASARNPRRVAGMRNRVANWRERVFGIAMSVDVDVLRISQDFGVDEREVYNAVIDRLIAERDKF